MYVIEYELIKIDYMKKYFIGLLVCLLCAVICLLALPTAVVILIAIALLATVIFAGGVLVLPMFFAYILYDWLKEKM
jgi:hypothetical protein